MPGKPMKDDYFSKITCDCGCENLMPQHLVDRGWKYLRGHKAKGGHIVTKFKNFNSTKAIHLHSSEVNQQTVQRFAQCQLDTLKKEVEAAESQISKGNAVLEQLMPRVRAWQLILGQLNEL